MQVLPTDYTILVDNREWKPLPLPKTLRTWSPGRWPPSVRTVRIHTKPAHLEFGDYVLMGSEKKVIVERKAHLQEIHTNLLGPAVRRANFEKELASLRDCCDHPILLLEGSPLDLERPRPTGKAKVDLDLVRDLLFATLTVYNIELLLLPSQSMSQRAATGRWLAARLIGGSYDS